MPKFSEVADVNIDAAQAWYDDDERVPTAFARCHPLVIAQARRMSGGDWRRCVVESDGGIVVHHDAKWQSDGEAYA